MTRVRKGLVAAWIGASFPWLACSSSSNAPANSGAHDGAATDRASGETAGGEVGAGDPYDPKGPYAACNDPQSQTATVHADGFAAWDGLAVLGCLNPSAPDAGAVAICDDSTVTDGAFTIMTSVCTGDRWDVHIFDGARGLDCNTTRPPIDHVFTLTPEDCACASGGDPSTGCAAQTDGGADGEAGLDAVDTPDGSNDGSAG
jgi:hypothetical protein